MIELPDFGPDAGEMWTALLDIADAVPQDWVVIGAQMVLLHALERGVQPPRFSADVDVLVNARVVSGRIAGFVEQIVQLGFELEGWSAEGVAHRYVRGAASIDVLAPEGLSSKSSLVTTPPGRTIQVPGGTQALHRAEAVDVRFAGRTATIHRPSLLGAIVAKSCAVDVDDAPANQRIDLAFSSR
jgi:hypothetical protein